MSTGFQESLGLSLQTTNRAAPPHPSILLVQMPWATIARPSIGVGILQAICNQQGIRNDAQYFNIDFAQKIGFELAADFSDGRILFGLSEHLFAVDLFGKSELNSDDFLFATAGALDNPKFLETLQDLRDRVIPEFLDNCARRVLAIAPTVVGFSATFNQVMASFALAARIRAAAPDIKLIFGGGCFSREMGVAYHRAMPDIIDHVFLGEAEVPFGRFIEAERAGSATSCIPGTTWYDNAAVEFDFGVALEDMRLSPMPDYDAFFRDRQQVEAALSMAMPLDRLLFEASRGCWWGQKNHCTFCGLNEDTIHFRAKPTAIVIEELRALSERHGCTSFLATDWILSRRERQAILEGIRDIPADLNVFFETRADLSKTELSMMKAAGVHKIQPGIESFSTNLLKVMRKHSTSIRQICFIRWCREAGIQPAYNLLGGFPGEVRGDYDQQSDLIDTIAHLTPPRRSLIAVEIHRFSPLFEQSSKMGIGGVEPRLDYRFNFPAGAIDLEQSCYFFEHERAEDTAVEAAKLRLSNKLDIWIGQHRSAKPPEYTYEVATTFVRVRDRRREPADHVLRGLSARILLLADSVTSRSGLFAALRPLLQSAERSEDLEMRINDAVDDLLSRGLIMAEGQALLTLPVGRRFRTSEELENLAKAAGFGIV